MRAKVTVFLTAIICLGIGAVATYFAYRTEHNARMAEADSQNEVITRLRLQIADAQAANATPPPPPPPVTPPPPPPPPPTAPTPTYTGFANTSATTTLKADFVTKLVKPYFDYKYEGQQTVTGITITNPATNGQVYKIAVTFDGGGTDSFDFGKRGSTLAWWKPTCTPGPCTFSDAFKTAYPEVVK
jgi:hypothetical protein